MYMLILSVSALIVCEGTDEVLKASLNTKVLSLINQFWGQLHYSTLLQFVSILSSIEIVFK